jgi:hypothetical protein
MIMRITVITTEIIIIINIIVSNEVTEKKFQFQYNLYNRNGIKTNFLL